MNCVILDSKFQSEWLNKMSLAAFSVLMAFLAQVKNYNTPNRKGWFVHRPHLYFNPYVNDKSWHKIESRAILELEENGFIKFHPKSWIEVLPHHFEGKPAYWLSDKKEDIDAPDTLAYNKNSILRYLD